jgi:YVTN family beta-propeller protein
MAAGRLAVVVRVVGSRGVSKIDPATEVVTASITVGVIAQGVAFDGTNIWVTNWLSRAGTDADRVSRINPTTNEVTATITVGGGPHGVAFDGTNIWVANFYPNTVSKIVPF